MNFVVSANFSAEADTSFADEFICSEDAEISSVEAETSSEIAEALSILFNIPFF